MAPGLSVIRNYSIDKRLKIKERNLKILFIANKSSGLRIAKSLFISKDKPELKSMNHHSN